MKQIQEGPDEYTLYHKHRAIAIFLKRQMGTGSCKALKQKNYLFIGSLMVNSAFVLIVQVIEIKISEVRETLYSLKQVTYFGLLGQEKHHV